MTRLPAAALERSDELVVHYVAERFGKSVVEPCR